MKNLTVGVMLALLVVATMSRICEPTTKLAGEYVHVIGAADVSWVKVAAVPEGGVWVYASDVTVTPAGKPSVQSILSGFSSFVDCVTRYSFAILPALSSERQHAVCAELQGIVAAVGIRRNLPNDAMPFCGSRIIVEYGALNGRRGKRCP